MRRIPVFDPSQVTNNPYINVGAANAGSKMLLYNESPYNLDLDFGNGNVSILHAWEARYWTLDGDTKQVGWVIDTALSVTAPPISLVMGELYDYNEMVEGSYPMALIRQASVGNAVNTNVSSSSTLLNTGNPTGTNVVTVNSTAAAGSTVTLTNDGLFVLAVTIAGALQTVLQSFEPAAAGKILQEGVATYLTEQMGNLKVDGTFESVGAITGDAAATLKGACTLAAAGALTHVLGTLTVDQLVTLASNLLMPNNVAIQAKDSTGTARAIVTLDASNNLLLQIGAVGATFDLKDSAGTAIFGADTGGMHINSKKILDAFGGNNLIDWSSAGVFCKGNASNLGGFSYQGSSGTTDWNINALGPAVTGSASATVNHLVKQFNASVAPTDFLMNPSTASGSQTFGFNTITSTQVNVVIGATNAYRFRGWK